MSRLIGLLGLLLMAPALPAAQFELDTLLQELQQERRAERRHNAEREARFLAERDRRQELLSQAQADLELARERAGDLRQAHDENTLSLHTLEDRLAAAAGDLGSLFEAARQSAADTRARQAASLLGPQLSARHEDLAALADGRRLPGIAQLEDLWLSLLDEMNQAGRIARFSAPVIGPDGAELERGITRIGTFSAFSEGRYLRRLPSTGQLVEPARQPPLRHLALAAGYERAEEGLHPLALDPSRGALLGLAGRTPDLQDRLRQGGIIGYVIIGLGGLALLLVLERFLVLGWIRLRMHGEEKRDGPGGDNPLGRLRRIADRQADASLESLDMHLDEAASREASKFTRGLSTLGVIAAMAPLLGLLGTVTGMIETFQTITLYGAGDPKLMSSGISQALVTTQLGLVVAVPVLLLHSFLKGRANRLIEILDRHATLLLSQRA